MAIKAVGGLVVGCCSLGLSGILAGFLPIYLGIRYLYQFLVFSAESRCSEVSCRVGAGTYANDVKVRRYFPAFIEACKVVALLRSFQRFKSPPARFEIDFADFAITTQIFEGVFTESLHRGTEQVLETREAVELVSKDRGGAAVDAKALAKHLRISKDQAYGLLRRASATGAVRKVNPPAKTNLKFFLAVPLPRFIPDPQIIFDSSPEIESPVEFIDPFTGKQVSFTRRKKVQR